MKKLMMLIFLFSGNLYSQTKNVGKTLESLTKIKNPFSLRDPFVAPKRSRSSAIAIKSGNKTEAKNWSTVTIDKIKVVGVLVGKNTRAVARVEGDNKVYILKEGMELGPEKAVLKAILPGGIVLVEKFVNVYGQEEFLETIIPISRVIESGK